MVDVALVLGDYAECRNAKDDTLAVLYHGGCAC
jgi:hypothetical protein